MYRIRIIIALILGQHKNLNEGWWKRIILFYVHTFFIILFNFFGWMMPPFPIVSLSEYLMLQARLKGINIFNA